VAFKVPGLGEWRFRLFPQKLYIPIVTLNHTIEGVLMTVDVLFFFCLSFLFMCTLFFPLIL
jgi:hypothetical protein